MFILFYLCYLAKKLITLIYTAVVACVLNLCDVIGAIMSCKSLASERKKIRIIVMIIRE